MSRPFATETVFRAIGHAARREVLNQLRSGEQTVSEIHQSLAHMGNAALSNHLRILREAGLIRQRRRGTFRMYELDPKPLAEVARWVRPFHGARTA